MSYNQQNEDYKKDIRVDAPPMAHYGHAPVVPPRRPSRFWLFALSVLPGLSHMYLGLIKRGLFYISTFALIAFLTVTLGGPFTIITGLGITALYAVAFFEAFAIRRDIVMGKEVSDSVPVIGKNKTVLVVIAVVVAAALGINILSSLPWYAWMILGIVAVCYFPVAIVRVTKGKKKDS